MIVRSKANEMLESLVQANSSSYYWIGLSTTTPTATGGNFTEPPIPSGAQDDEGQTITVNEYQRVNLKEYMGAATNAVIENESIIFFNEAEHYGWGTITHFGIFTSKTGGTPIFWGALSAPISVPQNYIPIFRANRLKIGLDQNPANPVTP